MKPEYFDRLMAGKPFEAETGAVYAARRRK